MQRHEFDSLIRVEGECALACAAELKSALLEGLAGGTDLTLDLEGAGQIDITILQLLWAAGREPEREAGFERFPGEPVQG